MTPISKEDIDQMKSLIDAVYEMVYVFKPKSPSQKVWREQWLENAKKFGAGFDI